MPEYFVIEGEENRSYTVESLGGDQFEVELPSGEKIIIDAFHPEDGRIHLLQDGKSFDFDIRELDGQMAVQMRGITRPVDVLNEREKRMRAAGVGARAVGGPELISPMAGKVVAVEVEEGEEVEQGDTVVIVEAMKMENDLKAHKPGIISKIPVAPGDAVEIGDALVEISEP